MFADCLGQRQAPRVELELPLSSAGAKRHEGLRHVEQVDDIVGKYIDVVGGLIHERTERHAGTMSHPFKRDPRVVTLRGRSPPPRELAETIGCSVDDILEGIESSNAYSTLSLDAGDGDEDGAATMLDAIGVDDENLEHVEIRESIKPLLDRLDAREKRILLLRFFKNMTQSQIAEEIGVSQMHVSRLLSRTLEQLRTSLEGDDAPES